MPMGHIASPDPDLDGFYEPRLDCLWVLEMPVNRGVNLTFSSFQLEASSTCRYDYVKVAPATPDVDQKHQILMFHFLPII